MPYYGNSCSDLTLHYCDPCEPVERGRVRGAALISASYFPTIAADPSNHVLWLAGIASNDIAMIPFTHGELAEPSVVDAPGIGNQVKQFVGYNFAATIYDRNYKENGNFWNQAKNVNNRVLAYTTEHYVHFSTNNVFTVAYAPVQDDLNSIVEWKAKFEWAAPDSPIPFTKPEGVFECPPLT